MTNTQNAKTMKSTMIVLAMMLALVAAALLQTKAEAATVQVSTGSIEDAKLASTNLPKGSGIAVKATSEPKTQSSTGGVSTRAVTTGYTGRPGYLASLEPIAAYAYYYGNQNLTNAGANIYPSPSYSGDQVITMRTRIFKRDVVNGYYSAWQLWANPAYSVRVRSDQYASFNRNWFASPDISSNEYVADVQVAWRTPGGTLIASQNIHMGNSGDYQCMDTCYKYGLEGQKRLALSYRTGQGGI